MFKQIFLIDDEVNILKAMKRELGFWAESRHYQITAINNPLEALQALADRHGQVDLIVSDLRMPEMKGSDLLLTVRQRWPHIGLILLTGYSETEEIIKAVKAGISSYILKPWDSDYLLAEIEKVLAVVETRELLDEQRRRLQHELTLAGQLQTNLLKVSIPEDPRGRFLLSYKPLSELGCGGDYYDIIRLGKDRYLLLTGDVAGHGVSGALITGILKSLIFSEYIRNNIAGFAPAHFLEWLNRRMLQALSQAESIIITFAAVVVDLESRRLEWALAGHNPPLLLRQGHVLALPATGPGLCFSDQSRYVGQSGELLPGDSLWLFTDGLIEVNGDETSLGTSRLSRCLEGLDLSHPEHSHEGLIAAVLASSGHPDWADDLTLLSFELF